MIIIRDFSNFVIGCKNCQTLIIKKQHGKQEYLHRS